MSAVGPQDGLLLSFREPCPILQKFIAIPRYGTWAVGRKWNLKDWQKLIAQIVTKISGVAQNWRLFQGHTLNFSGPRRNRIF